MMSKLHRPTLALMVGICLFAFGLRVWNITATNYDLDEAWTVDNVTYAQNPDTFEQIYREPNNTVHILLTIPLASLVWNSIGFRFLSIAAAMLTVAAMGRLAFRLYGREAAIIAAFISAISVYVIDYAQHVRPYMIAYLLAILATIAWVERRKGVNLLFSSLVPFFHIGAFSILMMQDAITLLKPRKWRYRSIVDWVIYRIPPYAMLLLMLYLVQLRRISGKVISSGQATPSPYEVLLSWINYSTGQENLTLAAWIFLAFGGICLAWFIFRRAKIGRVLLRPYTWLVPVLWITISYGVLVVMTIISDGPIKFFHIMHIAYASALLFAGILVTMPRPAWMSLIGLLLIGNGIALTGFYSDPYTFYTEAYTDLQAWRADNDDPTIYFEVVFPVQAMALGRPEGTPVDFFAYIEETATYPTEYPQDPYYYLAYLRFDPPIPAHCDPADTWRYGGFHLHTCIPDDA